jgi:N-acetylglucosaminyldiphosphoundecaprenol N-acetyl-beta-D-mannosaminyltransferase
MKYPRRNILGVMVSVINIDEALAFIESCIKLKQKEYICVTPAHSIMDCQRDKKLQSIFNQSGLTTPDGMSVVWLLKLFGYKDVSRVYGPDLLKVVCQKGLPYGWRHYFYGGKPGVAEKLVGKLEQDYPGIQVAGRYSPPFRELSKDEEENVIQMINKSKADIVWVGISSPKQEKWMAAFTDRLEAPLLIGIGAAFDFVSGEKSQAPVWIQRGGLEWLFRLVREPRRLWKRYIQYPQFGVLVLAQITGIKKFEP